MRILCACAQNGAPYGSRGPMHCACYASSSTRGVMVAVQNESKMPQRHSMNIPRSVLNAFSDLVKNGEKTRTAAAMLILQHVEEVLRRNEQVGARPAYPAKPHSCGHWHGAKQKERG
ncbi:hypothetical protein E2C01_055072 [Portunus trituberculatus]|uniref:Uncharacterized protein n=1 Tax=Portunus trituberculatus TaxID=210409 RepID=A0A5B7GLC9_PORTR|nr:hypothetical protein [Portunus trituberculatus]